VVDQVVVALHDCLELLHGLRTPPLPAHHLRRSPCSASRSITIIQKRSAQKSVMTRMVPDSTSS
jgi:hypothetical protein